MGVNEHLCGRLGFSQWKIRGGALQAEESKYKSLEAVNRMFGEQKKRQGGWFGKVNRGQKIYWSFGIWI